MKSVEYNPHNRQINENAKSLGLPEKTKRTEARLALEAAGKRSALILIEALLNGNRLARREAAEALATIKEPTTAKALVMALEDDDHDVRWTAMKALIGLDQDALEPLLQALMKDFGSVQLREGAQHILNALKKDSCLEKPIADVLDALKGVEPAVTGPWVAQAAWESLYGPKKNG